MRNIKKLLKSFVIGFFICLLIGVSTAQIVRSGEIPVPDEIKGRVSEYSGREIKIDGKSYRVTRDTVVKDLKGNTLPRKSLKSAVIVKVEGDNGEAKTIYVEIKKQ